MDEENIKSLYEKYAKKHTNFITNVEKDPAKQGKIRAARGNFLETFASELWQDIGLLASQIHTSDSKKHTLRSKSNFPLKKGLDKNLYKNGTIVAMVEAKSYLDSCYYRRACDDAKELKRKGFNVQMAIVTLEDSIKQETRDYWNEEDPGQIDKEFYLTKGKRSSISPIYKNFKQIDYDQFKALCIWMWSL